MPQVTENKIIERFNDAVNAVHEAYQASTIADISEAQKHLERSASAIYQSLEWASKKILFRIFNDPVAHATEIGIIEGSNFHRKIDLLQKQIKPIRPVGVNFGIIKELKQQVRNDPEHSGFTPHFNSLKSVIEEGAKLLQGYLSTDITLNTIKTPQITNRKENDTIWTEFLDACDSFSSARNYILAMGPNENLDVGKIQPIGLINWSMVIDFDPNTEVNGLYLTAGAELATKKKVYLLTKQDSKVSFSPNNAAYWIAGNGLKGRAGTETSSFKEWSFKYSTFLQQLATAYFNALDGRPTTFVITWNNRQFVQELCKTFYNAFGANIEFVYAVPNPPDLEDVTDTYSGRIVKLSLSEISEGILKIRNFFNPIIDGEVIGLPSKDEKFVVVDKLDFFWIEEDLELVHNNILDRSEFNQQKSDFLRGQPISWAGLHFHYDVTRDITQNVKRGIERALDERKTTLISLSHYPGIGGTTLGRRLLWELHGTYPAVALKKVRPQSTIDRVYRVFELTKLPPMILADSAIVSFDEVQKLLTEIRGRNFPALLLLVQRNETAISSKGTYYLPGVLTDLEFRTFVEFYINEAPSKREAFNGVLSHSDRKEKHPFYLGLLAFEDKFHGLQQFIARGLADCNEIQRKAAALISLCYIYGQQALSAQLLQELFMTEINRIVKLENHLPNSLLHLLINSEELKWKPIHYLVGKELLAQVLGGGSVDTGHWRQSLPELSIDFIKILAQRSNVPSDSDMELLRRLFIYRDNQEILGKEGNLFSSLIEDGLVSDEARLRIFKQLTESFPNESHFWGHLARFYNLKMHNNDEALVAVDRAIDLSNEEDDLLFHMKGMCLRGKAYDIMNRWFGRKDVPSDKLPEIVDLVEESSESFKVCRELNPFNEHGYVSHVQMIIRSIDFGFSISNYERRSDYLRNLNTWSRQELDEAESLLEGVKRIKRTDLNNNYIEKCDIDIQGLYENYSLVIEGWNNMLVSKDVNKPPIRRQIVRAYVRRARSWDKIEEKDAEKMIKLIEQNIEEEPRNESNIYLWFHCARQIRSSDVNTAIDKIANWRSNSNGLEPTYILGILHSIQAINGTTTSKVKAEQLIRESSERTRSYPNRTFCFEWLGPGSGLKALTRNIQAFSRKENEILFNKQVLRPIRGKISVIRGPEAGYIELDCGLSAFFVPAREGFVKDRDSNQNVSFFLGFSYDGLRAWNVQKAD